MPDLSPPEIELRPAEPRGEGRYSLREAARILDVPEARLRALARAGLLAPQRGPLGPLSFGFRDILLLRTTKGLLDSGVPMQRIRRIWSSLRGQIGADQPLTSITIRAEGENVMATDGHTTWQPDSGQFVLDFEKDGGSVRPDAAERAPVAAGPGIAGNPRVAAGPGVMERAGAAHPAAREPAALELTPEQWFERAIEIEASSPAQAIEAYQRVLERDPLSTEAHVNLGRLYHLAGERGRAEAHYRDAVRLAPGDPIPHFNLGVLMEEQGRKDEAVNAYLQALNRDAEFADAHCNLGLLLESMGRRHEAVRHLMSARELYRSG